MLKIKAPDDALNVKQMMKLLDCGRKTIFNYKSKGLIPKPIHLSSKRMFWTKDVIEKWMEGDGKKLTSRLKNFHNKNKS
jgi:predicted DNA-binding transcriptional regulator AlpA